MAVTAMEPGATACNGWLLYAAVLLVGAALYAVCRFFPADLPWWMPWEFSWPVYLSTVLALGWFWRGLARLEKSQRPPLWRNIAFVLGVVSTYAVMQTHYDYLSQHLFFFHRLQHLVLHHAGPFLIALGTSGRVLWAGMPKFLQPLFGSRPVRRAVDVIQNPMIAPLLFVGLIYLWLIPDMHMRVMLDVNLYDLMNWSMAIDGIFFWTLILDPRPKPPARLSYGWRALMVLAIEPPQALIGAVLSLSSTDYYQVYQICGRVLPISGLTDQHYGGLILWIPSAMMSLFGLLVVLTNMFFNEERGHYAKS
ncbi:MAG TPA: cytochrome c oxidase assembly protein [Rhizomicrobium sp.]|nr:cytochrome c oxidase assembly protein [Rhizomicrobium sp.]